MNQTERRLFLIHSLIGEQTQYQKIIIPENESEQKKLLRFLLNIRMPNPVSKEFLTVQDAYLQEETRRKGITKISDLKPITDHLYLWQGDITTLCCDAIVNAANSQMLGCFVPCHGCIDNAIHTFSGVQLRLTCAKLMKQQGQEEEPGKAKLTPAFNLPSRYIIHTVGPIVQGKITDRDKELLASCYRSCLELAHQNKLKSIAFSCISTGEFHFPSDKAAQIAIQTVKDYISQTQCGIEVIFNVFKESDYFIYKKLLRTN